MNKKITYLVTSITPHRISFAGGATDLPKFYKIWRKFLNSSIDKFVYVTVKGTVILIQNLGLCTQEQKIKIQLVAFKMILFVIV